MQQYSSTTDQKDTATITPNKKAPKEDKGFFGTAVDAVKGAISGIPKEAENIVQAVHDTADFIDNKIGDGTWIDDNKDYDFVPDALKPETGVGETFQALSAFATGWVTGGKLISTGVKALPAMTKLATVAPKTAKYVDTAMRGGVIDFLSGDGSDKRVADVIVDNDIFGKAVAQYLASDDDDSLFEGRVKNVAEGFLLGGAVDVLGTALKFMKKGAKASVKGNLDKSLAIRKEGAAAVEATENAATASKQAAKDMSSAEAVKNAMGDDWANPSGEKYTGKALKQKGAKAQKKNLGKVIDDIKENLKESNAFKKAFNTRQYSDEAAAIIDGFQEGLDTATKNDHMSMAGLHLKSLEYTKAHNLDKVFDKEALLTTGGLKDVDSRIAIHTQANWLNVFMPDQVGITLQQVKEGITGSMEKARKLTEDIFDVTLDLKQNTMFHAQNVKSADLNAGNGLGTTLTKNAVTGDAEVLGRQLIADKSDDEIIELLTKLKTVADNGDVKDIKKIIAAASNGDANVFKLMGVPMDTVMNSIYKYRYIAMLSSVKTHLRNFVGNTAKIPLIAFEEGVQGAVLGWKANEGLGRKVVGALAGSKDGIYFIQGLNYAKRQAWETLQNAWKYNDALTRPSEWTDIAAKQSDWGLFEAPLKALKASDEFFASLTGTAKAYEMAMLDLKKSGVLKNATPEIRAEITSKWIDDYIGNSYMSMTMKDGKVVERATLGLKDMREIADEATFQQQMDKVGKSINNFVSTMPGAKLVFPFVSTPYNIFKDVFWTRGPGAVVEVGKAMKSGDPVAQAKAIGHVTSGAFLWTTAYGLVMSGKITGQGPDNKNQRDRLKMNGWQSHCYVTDDGTYLDLNALEPYGSMLSFMADITEKSEREGLSPLDLDNVWNCLLSTAKDKTFLKGFSELMLSMDRGTTLEHNGFMAQMGISFIPSLLRDFGQFNDPIRRETPDFYSKAIDRTPMRGNLAPKVNWLTGEEETYTHGGGLGSMFNMWSGSQDKGSAVFYELARLTGVGEPSDELIKGKKLSSEQYSDYCRAIGQTEIGGKTLYQTLDEVINSDAYQRDVEQRPDESPYEVNEERAKRLRKIIKTYKDTAKAQFLRDNPEMAQREDIFSAITES